MSEANRKPCREVAASIYIGYKEMRESILKHGIQGLYEWTETYALSVLLIEDYDLAINIAESTTTASECLERCKQILVLKGELP